MDWIDYEKVLAKACDDVAKEKARQLKKWGIQRHSYPEWRAILDEELAEFACKVIAAKENGYDELTHVVAVGLSWLIDIKLTEDAQGQRIYVKEKGEKER